MLCGWAIQHAHYQEADDEGDTDQARGGVERRRLGRVGG